MRIPSADHLAHFCLTKRYRRCTFFRRYLDMLVATPEQWTSPRHGKGAPGGTAIASVVSSVSMPAQEPKVANELSTQGTKEGTGS